MAELASDAKWLDDTLAKAIFYDIETGALDPEKTSVLEAAITQRTAIRKLKTDVVEKEQEFQTIFDVLVKPFVPRTEAGRIQFRELKYEEIRPWTILSWQKQIKSALDIRAKDISEVAALLAKEKTAPQEFNREIEKLTRQKFGILQGQKFEEYSRLLGPETRELLTPSELRNRFFQTIKSKDLWIHNLPFESRFMGAMTTPEEFLQFTGTEWKGFARDINLQAIGIGGTQKRLYQTSSEIENALSRVNLPTNKKDYLTAWEDVAKAYQYELDKPLEQLIVGGERVARIFNSQTLFSSVIAQAQKAGIMEETGDVFSGTNLDIISRLLFGQAERHEALADTQINQAVVDWLLSQSRRMSTGQKLTEFSEKVLKTISTLQPALRFRSRMKTAFTAYEGIMSGEGYEVVHRNIPFQRRIGRFNENWMIEELPSKTVTFPEKIKIQRMEDFWERMKRRKEFGDSFDWGQLRYQFEQLIKGASVEPGKPEHLVEMQRIARRYEEEMFERAADFKGLRMGVEEKTILERVLEAKKGGGKYVKSNIGLFGAMVGGLYLGSLAYKHFTEYKPETEEVKYPDNVGPWSLVATKADLVRASTIGKSEEEIYNYMTGKEEKFSDFSEVAMSTGTALHRVLEKVGVDTGQVESEEQMVFDPRNRVVGHYDIRYKTGEIQDIKTVSPKRWAQIMQSGPDWEHEQQVNFYGIVTGAPAVSIRYVQAEHPEKQRVFQFTPSEETYEYSMAKVARVRRQVAEEGSAATFSPALGEITDKLDSIRQLGLSSTEELISKYMAEREHYKELRRIQNGQRFSGRDDSYNTIEGLQERGIAGAARKILTHFGSGYAIDRVFAEMGEESMKAYMKAGYDIGDIPGRDDAYNTIEGMKEGGYAGWLRHYNTDFGSGFLQMKVDKLFSTLSDLLKGNKYEEFYKVLIELNSRKDIGIGYQLSNAFENNVFRHTVADSPHYGTNVMEEMIGKKKKISALGEILPGHRGHFQGPGDVGVYFSQANFNYFSPNSLGVSQNLDEAAKDITREFTGTTNFFTEVQGSVFFGLTDEQKKLVHFNVEPGIPYGADISTVNKSIALKDKIGETEYNIWAYKRNPANNYATKEEMGAKIPLGKIKKDIYSIDLEDYNPSHIRRPSSLYVSDSQSEWGINFNKLYNAEGYESIVSVVEKENNRLKELYLYGKADVKDIYKSMKETGVFVNTSLNPEIFNGGFCDPNAEFRLMHWREEYNLTKPIPKGFGLGGMGPYNEFSGFGGSYSNFSALDTQAAGYGSLSRHGELFDFPGVPFLGFFDLFRKLAKNTLFGPGIVLTLGLGAISIPIAASLSKPSIVEKVVVQTLTSKQKAFEAIKDIANTTYCAFRRDLGEEEYQRFLKVGLNSSDQQKVLKSYAKRNDIILIEGSTDIKTLNVDEKTREQIYDRYGNNAFSVKLLTGKQQWIASYVDNRTLTGFHEITEALDKIKGGNRVIPEGFGTHVGPDVIKSEALLAHDLSMNHARLDPEEIIKEKRLLEEPEIIRENIKDRAYTKYGEYFQNSYIEDVKYIYQEVDELRHGGKSYISPEIRMGINDENFMNVPSLKERIKKIANQSEKIPGLRDNPIIRGVAKGLNAETGAAQVRHGDIISGKRIHKGGDFRSGYAGFHTFKIDKSLSILTDFEKKIGLETPELSASIPTHIPPVAQVEKQELKALEKIGNKTKFPTKLVLGLGAAGLLTYMLTRDKNNNKSIMDHKNTQKHDQYRSKSYNYR